MVWNRRQLMAGSLCGIFALAARRQQTNLFAADPKVRAKRCIVLWMEGGPSQLDTFDLKPGTRNGGEFRPIATASDELRISEHLPSVAKHMDRLSVIRNLTSKEGDHDRGSYYLHTGYAPVPSFPRPNVGSVISKHSSDSDVPRFVTLGSSKVGPAFMGPDHAPFSIESPDQAKQLLNDLSRRRNRLSLIEKLSHEFETQHPDAMIERRKSMLAKIERIVTTRFADALEIAKEPEHVRTRYGETDFGRSCLIARRLIEVGVNFVEVHLGGWDTHANNFQAVRELSGQLDKPWAALMDDLKSSGLFDETVVVWMGEFGRTPLINGQNGRDHFPDITPVVIGGGGFQGGKAIGKTTKEGSEIDGASVRVPDLFATLFHQFGIPLDAEFTTSFDSPTKATDGGRLISELL